MIDKGLVLNYNIYAVDSFQQGGGASMEYIVAFIISVTASIAGYYACRWIEKKNKDS
ncbi:MAG: hypothetical protein RHS_4668 [Robinsoniella sp. RHS]|nr:MAG: hypothetical protein RHS_4668 [Robinsoniella sp. RHS]